ncbi:MAG: hypothetical protein HKL95_06065 [Phycisphaerae bacterium]|nr:hypothetical protein [Phycisphaerae bacterium]
MEKGRPYGARQTADAVTVRFVPARSYFPPMMAATVLLLTGCTAIVPPKMKHSPDPAPEVAVVSHALAQWPRPSSRLFTGMLVVADQHVRVLGLWRFRTPWSFRLAVAKANGRLLFESRANWAGVHLLHLQPGFSRHLALAISHDVSLATRSPPSLGAVRLGRHQTQIVARDAWGDIIIWQFSGLAGRLRQMLVRRHAGDILTVRYGRYGSEGWPRTMALYRPALDYALTIQSRRFRLGH